jgi:hypothetical protein
MAPFAGSAQVRNLYVGMSFRCGARCDVRRQAAQQEGRFAMELSHYDPVPAQIQKQLTEAYKPKAEED